MACTKNKVTQHTGICVIFDIHLGIMAALSDPHLGWVEPSVYHRIFMCHLASNFMTRFNDKLLKNLVCRAALATKQHKFNRYMAIIGRINLETQ